MCRFFLIGLVFFIPFSTVAVEFSDSCGKEWQWASPLPLGNNLNAIAWSEEQKQFIAVGDGGAILRSVDGEKWLTASSGISEKLTDIVWGKQRWIAVGGLGTIITSSDGINWEKQVSGTENNITAIELNEQQWIATATGWSDEHFSYTGLILKSSDGIAWEESWAGIYEPLSALKSNGELWVGVTDSGTIINSSDGTIWQQHNLGTQYHFNAIDWNGQYWIAVGIDYDNFRGAIFSSSDGIVWNEQNGEFSEYLNDVSWNGKKWIAVGDGGSNESIILSSVNGTTWLEQSSKTKNPLNAITWNGKRWIAVGDYGTIILSNEGVIWEQKFSGWNNRIYAVDWNGKEWVAVGDSSFYIDENGDSVSADSIILTSTDGATWTKQFSNTGEYQYLYSLDWDGRQWVAVGASGTIISSIDGIEWNPQVSGIDESFVLNDIVWIGDKWITVGDKGDYYNDEESIILSSKDGVTWSKHSSGTKLDLNAIGWNGKQIVAVGVGDAYTGIGDVHDDIESVILTSSDGTNWEKQISGTTLSLLDVSWNGQQWVVVGSEGLILSSNDGITWSQHSSGTSAELHGVNWDGRKWIAVGGNGSIFSSWEGTVVTSLDGLNWESNLSVSNVKLHDVSFNHNQWIAVGIGGAIIRSNCYPKTTPTATRAIIVAGGGNPDDPLQPATNKNANLAYQTLRQRGISKANIKYFNAIAQDADNDGLIDTEVGKPTRDAIKQAITEWGVSQLNQEIPLLLYLVDHGGSDLFYLNKPSNDYAEVIKANELTQWLNTLQEATSARVSLVYDACHSGSFMDELALSSTQSFDRTVLFSSAPEQLAYFGAKGALSFSHFFWNNIGQGMDLRTAHRSATAAVRATTQNDGDSYQSTLMDDNGDGEDNYVDGALSHDTHIGVDNHEDVMYPRIVAHQESTTLDISDSGKVALYARVDLPPTDIARVWAVVIPPNSKTTGSEAVTELPVIELDSYNPINGHYEASSDIFTQSGQYTVSYYAQTTEGVNSRFPVVSLIMVTDSGYQALEQRNLNAVIVVGGYNIYDPLHKAATNNANLAWQTLRNRGVNADNIFYINYEPQDVDGDGHLDTRDTAVSSGVIEQAVSAWRGPRVNPQTPLLIYFVGDGIDEHFLLNSEQTDSISASGLSDWLDDLQAETQARVTFVYDAPESGSFMKPLSTPSGSGYERINIMSTAAGQGAYFGAEGQLSFSQFFWSNTARGLDVRQAFLESLHSLTIATGNSRSQQGHQEAQLDDNGDGVWEPGKKGDGRLARVTYLGLNAATASTFPVVFAHQGDLHVDAQAQGEVTLSAKVDLPPEYLAKVWVLLDPPSQTIETTTSITHLPKVELFYNSSNRTYEGKTSQFTESGEYILTYYAQSTQGNISEPLRSTVEVTQNVSESFCGQIDSDFNVILPCVQVGDGIYQATLQSISHPDNSDKLMWQLNTITPNADAYSTPECASTDAQLNLYLNCVKKDEQESQMILHFYPGVSNQASFLWEQK